jgi:CBS domain containing-hemolysin-like protein
MNSGMQLLVAMLMVVGNAFFVGAEFGLVSSRRSSIELLALKGSAAAKVTLNAMEHVSLMLAGAQLGVTLCSLIFGAVSEPLLSGALETPVSVVGLGEGAAHAVSLTIALIILVYVHVVIGEMVPKNLALAGPTRAALWLTPPLIVFVRITRPIVLLLNTISNHGLQFIGIKPRREVSSAFDRDEVAGFVKESHREGLLSTDEEHLLSGALTFEQRTIESVLLPTSKLVTVPITASPHDIEACVVSTGFSRVPIIDRHDDLVGYVHIKDLLSLPSADYSSRFPSTLIRPLPELSLQTSLRRALINMQRVGAHLAKVTDAKGYTVGAVALEDLLEELVGTIKDDAQRYTKVPSR